MKFGRFIQVDANNERVGESTYDIPTTCPLCGEEDCSIVYDAMVPTFRQWSYLCDDCFKDHACELGMGRGQKFELIDEEV